MRVVWKTFVVVFFLWVFFVSYKYIAKEFKGLCYETEVALTSSITNSFQANVLVIRKEELIKTIDSKIINYLVNDGEKVAIGDSIANLYDTDQDIQMAYNLKNLENELKLLSEVKLLKNNKNLVSEVLYNQISDNLSNFITLANKKVLDNFYKVKDDLLISLIKKNVVYGRVLGLEDKIKNLENQVEMCKKNFFNLKTVTSNYTGYFASKVDGYEYLSMPEDVKKVDYNVCVEILKSQPNKISKNDYIGKIITDFEWYVIFKTNKNNIDRLNGANKLNFNFEFPDLENVPAVIVDVKESNDGKSGIVISKSNYMSKDISNLRRMNVDVSTDSFYGIFVNVDAVRFVDGKKGVFIKDGKEIKFKKIDTIFENNKKIISQIRPLDGDYLQPFDLIILNGQNLYDGKNLDK